MMGCVRESVPKETVWTSFVFTPTGSVMRCARGGPESVPKETEWTIVCVFYHHRERDEMCERVAALTAQNQSLSQREEELYQQVKRSIALVEQAQLEQTEVGLKNTVSACGWHVWKLVLTVLLTLRNPCGVVCQFCTANVSHQNHPI